MVDWCSVLWVSIGIGRLGLHAIPEAVLTVAPNE